MSKLPPPKSTPPLAGKGNTKDSKLQHTPFTTNLHPPVRHNTSQSIFDVAIKRFAARIPSQQAGVYLASDARYEYGFVDCAGRIQLGMPSVVQIVVGHMGGASYG